MYPLLIGFASEDEWREYYRDHDPTFCNALNGFGKAYARVTALSSKIQKRAPPTSVLAINMLVVKHCHAGSDEPSDGEFSTACAAK
jgi:hypothetical protein